MCRTRYGSRRVLHRSIAPPSQFGIGCPPSTTEVQRPRERGDNTYAVVRSYSGQGTSELFDALGQRADEVKSLIGGVPGFVSYAAVRTGDGGTTVTVCQDKAGTDESSRRAAEWVKDNVSTTGNPPVVTEGSTVLQFTS
jgi:hypothetical protein